MGYYLEAFICRTTDAACLTNIYDQAANFTIGQGLSLIPMTGNLFDQLNDLTVCNDLDNFKYLTETIEHKILPVIGMKPFSYVEAEYHGGQGGQTAIIWENSNQIQRLSYGQDRINTVLRYFGVVTENKNDEFATLGLGRYRHTDDWGPEP